MESAQRDLLSFLLGHVFSLGLISKSTRSRAEDLVYSAVDLPEFFRYPVCPAKEADGHGCTRDAQ